MPATQCVPEPQHAEQPHSASSGGHSGWQLPLIQVSPHPQGGVQTFGTQTYLCIELSNWHMVPGSMHCVLHVPPQPSSAPHALPVQSGLQQALLKQVEPLAQHFPAQTVSFDSQQTSSFGLLLLSLKHCGSLRCRPVLSCVQQTALSVHHFLSVQQVWFESALSSKHFSPSLQHDAPPGSFAQ